MAPQAGTPAAPGLDGMLDTEHAMQVWEAALAAPVWDRAPVWLHGDLLAGNILVNHGRVAAVIDFGGLGVGDPACDLVIAWSLFSGESRSAFRQALGAVVAAAFGVHPPLRSAAGRPK